MATTGLVGKAWYPIGGVGSPEQPALSEAEGLRPLQCVPVSHQDQDSTFRAPSQSARRLHRRYRPRRQLHSNNLAEQIERTRWIKARIAGDGVGDAADGWAWAQRLLRDHSAPVCHHQPNQATLWSLVADLTARRVAYCLGAPCRNEFHEWDWPRDETLSR